MTLAERDRQTLEEAHIDLDEVATEIAALIRRDNRELVSPIIHALSEPERAFLRRGGAIGLDPTPVPWPNSPQYPVYSKRICQNDH